MTVEMRKVSSSNLESVGHDPATSELHVKFKSGPLYIHSAVSADQHAAMMGMDSPGKHYFANIRGKPQHPHRIP